MSEPAITPEEAEKALQTLREATDGALEGSGLLEAVHVIISQRDNARHYADTFQKKLADLGHNFV